MSQELVITLNRDDADALHSMAISEYRTLQQQAAYLIKLGMETHRRNKLHASLQAEHRQSATLPMQSEQ